MLVVRADESGVSALVWLHGDQYTLPNQPPEPGPVQIVWSDGAHSLTWSPGVQLMWMSGATHLMCGRGGHITDRPFINLISRIEVHTSCQLTTHSPARACRAHRGSSRTAGGAALCWALSQPALAQQAKDESWARDVVVVTGQAETIAAPSAATATRTPTPIEEIPQSIQTLTRTLIEEQELQTLPGALTNVSGVTPTSTMQTVLMATLIRGFSVNYYFDGMPTYQLPPGISDPATLINVERIEVAKGPTSTLYGGGSGAPLSGLINVVSRDPGAEFGGSVGLRAGSFGTLGVDADLNVPLGESVAFRINGMAEQADSYIDFIDSKRYAIFPTLAWDISADTRLVVRGRYNHLEQQEYAGVPWEIISSIDRNQYAGASDAPRTEIENKQVSAFLSHSFSDTLEANFALSHYDGAYEEWASFPYGQIAGTLYNFGNGYLPSDSQEDVRDGEPCCASWLGRVHPSAPRRRRLR